MPRSTWEALPVAVRTAIERETGRVHDAVLPDAGRNSDFSATLHTETGTLFCKGIADADGKRGRMHRHEAAVNRFLPPAVAPRLLWRTEADGWLLLGFEHSPGHHVDLSPGSADLDPVRDVVTAMAAGLSTVSVDAPSLAEQWGEAGRLATPRQGRSRRSRSVGPRPHRRADELGNHRGRARHGQHARPHRPARLEPAQQRRKGPDRRLGLVTKRQPSGRSGLPHHPPHRSRPQPGGWGNLGRPAPALAANPGRNQDGIRGRDLGYLGIPRMPPAAGPPPGPNRGRPILGSAQARPLISPAAGEGKAGRRMAIRARNDCATGPSGSGAVHW